MMGDVCLFCKAKNKPGETKRRLENISILLRGEQEERGEFYLNWGIHFRCTFGMGCPSLDVSRIELMNLARGLNSKMRYLALKGSDAKFYAVLRNLQGEFPAVYRQMEVWRAEGRKSHDGNNDA